MSIPDSGPQRKVVSGNQKIGIVVALLIVAVSVSAFALGRLSGIGAYRHPVVIATGTVPVTDTMPASLFVASRNSDKYHYPWCPGARRITEQNKRTFSSREAANQAGYEAAQNCDGL